MTVTALPGNVRFRAFQLGVQSTFGTPVAATRRMPWRFTPTVDPHWTTPDVDTGTLDPAIQPYRTALDVTGQSVGPLAFDDAPSLYAALLKGGDSATGSSTGRIWDFQPASSTADPFELFTAEWGDEVTGDQWRYQDGILGQLQLQYPEDLGPIVATADWRFGTATYPMPGGMTSGLKVAPQPAWAYMADTTIYIDDVVGSIGISPLVNTVHGMTVTINTNPDVKRFANGSNANFAVQGYGRGARTLETTITLAKSTQGIAEAVKWLNANPQERFLSLDTVARQVVGSGSTPYRHRLRFAGYWFTRSEGAINSNSTIQLVCRHVYDQASGLAPIGAYIVNSAATLLPAA